METGSSQRLDRRAVIALSLGGVYLVACVLGLWHPLYAVLLTALVSPVAAAFMFPREANGFSRILIGAFIDAVLAGLVFVPVAGDLIDAGAGLAALIIVIVRFRQLAVSLPGGLTCLVLYAFLWFEARLLPDWRSSSGIHHALLFTAVAVIGSVVVGAAILAGLALLLGLIYQGDRAKAVFCAIGFPWYLISFLFTIFLPNRQADRARSG